MKKKIKKDKKVLTKFIVCDILFRLSWDVIIDN